MPGSGATTERPPVVGESAAWGSSGMAGSTPSIGRSLWWEPTVLPGEGGREQGEAFMSTEVRAGVKAPSQQVEAGQGGAGLKPGFGQRI